VNGQRHDAVDRALEDLGRVAFPVEASEDAARRRDRLVGALGSALGRVRARRTFVRRARIAVTSVLALGLVAFTVLALVKFREPPASATVVTPESWRANDVVGSVHVQSGGTRRAVATGDLLGVGDVVQTDVGASVSLGLPSGDVKLVSPGRIEVVSTTAAERRLRVLLGAVDVDLPRKLPNGQALIVETPDAQVRVVGTAFRVDVSIDDAGKPATEVSVRRGTVWVTQRGERRATLGAGSKWRSTARALARTALDPAANETPAKAALAPSRASRVAEAQGTLAEENRLYEVALASRNAGDDRRAAEAFGQLLTRYPRSVLGEQSLAERFRALDRAGQVSLSVAAARRYLAAYPDGFARADAERIVKR
jgi:hypothetical protein